MKLATPFTYLSLGAGVQSSALLAMSALGLKGCPRANVAIFADTQAEPSWVYEHLNVLTAFAAKHGLPVERVTAGNLEEHIQEAARLERTRVGSIPAFTKLPDGRAGPLRRQCTREYKITPIEKRVRALHGYAPRVRIRDVVVALIGISTDEATRMKPNRTRWITNRYPLIDAGMNRDDCKRLLVEVGLPVPKKSACVFCPYHSDSYWRGLAQDAPDEFERACRADDAVRDLSAVGGKNPGYLHRSLRPLRERPFALDSKQTTMDWFENECEGHCGV